MKNDLLLFAVMFAVAWIGFANLKDYLQPNQPLPEIEQSLTVTQSSAPPTDEELIRQLMGNQVQTWNRGDLDGFMQTYWKNEALTFSSGGETTSGWQAIYARYRQQFPEGEMGEIEFENLRFDVISDQSAIVMGKFSHLLPEEDLRGSFSLVLKKFDNQWKIIHDHTSIAE